MKLSINSVKGDSNKLKCFVHARAGALNENEIVMTEETGAKYPVVEKTLRPVVQGVVVVCQGAGDITVVSNITNAVSVVLNIPSNRVCVIKMQ